MNQVNSGLESVGKSWGWVTWVRILASNLFRDHGPMRSHGSFGAFGKPVKDPRPRLALIPPLS
jgi:hypothetical protein